MSATACRTVDSSVWISYFSKEGAGESLTRTVEGRGRIVTPSIVVYEVYRYLKRHCGEEVALTHLAPLYATEVVPLDESLALEAADLSLAHGLHMADAIVYATARRHGATLVTRDAHFKGLGGVEQVA